MVENGEFDKEDRDLKPFYNIRNELSISIEGIILRQSKIVIPKTLQKGIIEIGHEGHQSSEKTKQLLNQFVWFPGINQMVERIVYNCKACSTNSEKKRFEPLKMSQLPIGVWQNLAMDFHGPLPDGHYFVVVMDEYSRFPIVRIIKSTAARNVIPILSEIFQLFGIPNQMKTDNGPPFQGHEFQEYLRSMGVKHVKITPYWPRANGMVERFMRNLNKVLRNSKVTGIHWRDELDRFLRNYRNTPHESTGVSPASLMFKTTSISTRLPHSAKAVESLNKKFVRMIPKQSVG